MAVRDWQIRLIQLLAVPGMILSYYLLLFHSGVLVAVCGAGGWDDCGIVSGPDAAFSAIGPVPLALIGLIGYASIFLLTWLRDWLPALETYLPEILAGVVGLAFLFSLFLTGLELFVIGAFCRYCVISALIVTIMFILSVSYLRAANTEPDI